MQGGHACVRFNPRTASWGPFGPKTTLMVNIFVIVTESCIGVHDGFEGPNRPQDANNASFLRWGSKVKAPRKLYTRLYIPAGPSPGILLNCPPLRLFQ